MPSRTIRQEARALLGGVGQLAEGIRQLEAAGEQLEALANASADAACWTAPESALVATADALHDRATLTAAEWRRLNDHFDAAQALEVMMLCGFYRTVAYIANGLALAPEPFAAGLPS